MRKKKIGERVLDITAPVINVGLVAAVTYMAGSAGVSLIQQAINNHKEPVPSQPVVREGRYVDLSSPVNRGLEKELDCGSGVLREVDTTYLRPVVSAVSLHPRIVQKICTKSLGLSLPDDGLERVGEQFKNWQARRVLQDAGLKSAPKIGN